MIVRLFDRVIDIVVPDPEVAKEAKKIMQKDMERIDEMEEAISRIRSQKKIW